MLWIYNAFLRAQFCCPNQETFEEKKFEPMKKALLCLGMRISFENINLTQIQCLENKKISNLDLSQIHNCYKND